MGRTLLQFDTISGAAVVGDDLVLWDASANKQVKIKISAFITDLKIARTNTAHTWTAAQNFADQILQRPLLLDWAETAVTIASSIATDDLDLELGNVFDLTLDDSPALTFSNPPATGKGGSFTLILRQDATGSRTVTWPASVQWAGGTAPTLTAAGAGIDILTFITKDGGNTWFGFVGGQAFA